MRPAAPLLFQKTVPPLGDVINGVFVPGGTAVGWNLFSMMRSQEHWGPDAEIFRPERFMEADDKTRGSMERLVDLAFGYGRYACAGKPLALMELNKVFFEVSQSINDSEAVIRLLIVATTADIYGAGIAVPLFRLPVGEPGKPLEIPVLHCFHRGELLCSDLAKST